LMGVWGNTITKKLTFLLNIFRYENQGKVD
jgi:hypothetical protein